jgi:uncharacterized protein YdaU (DUF1376 family)
MAYLRLIWLYYEQEKPLINNTKVLAFKIGTDEQTIDLILKSFFKLENDEWHQTRCNDVIDSYQKQSTGGKLGAEIRWGKGKVKGAYSPPIATPIATNNHKPITNNHKPIKNITTPSGVDVSLWEDYLKVRKAAKKPITETALKGLVREAEKARMSLSDVLQTCCENSWVGFKAEWLNKSVATHDKPAQKWDANIQGVVNKGRELGILPRPGETEGQYRERVKSGFA